MRKFSRLFIPAFFGMKNHNESWKLHADCFAKALFILVVFEPYGTYL